MASTHTSSSTLHSSSSDLSSLSMAASVPRGHSPSDIQSHLYAAFLERRTADVALRIHGSWSAIYKLHRVILIQSGFFQSLFTSGFAESKSTLSNYRSGPEVIDLHFDDPNITRAAFEICIARLYGGGPPLYLSPTLCPTPAHPLTSSFPNASPAIPPPPTHHPATPRLLLSLLATAVFLSVPSVAAHALNAVLASVGPYTAVRYLRFASGHGIGPSDASEPHAAVGLEGVAEPITDTDDTASIASCATVRTVRTAVSASTESEVAVKEDPADTPCDSDDDDNMPNCYYGTVSNKVGEAAACWLARWGVDMLRYEEQAVSIAAGPSVTSRKRATTVPSRNGRSGEEDSSREWNRDRDREKEKEKEAAKNMVIPRVWRRGGVNARWVRGLVSSDALFVRGERERFDLARAVVEMRRREGVDADEEKEFLEMFTSGIYYANMSMGDLVSISRDVSPVTGKSYVPLGVLQAALWDQSVLRHRITSRQTSASSSAPGSQDKELGIALTTANILSVISSERAQDGEKERMFYAIPTDSSVRIGDSTGVEGASMEQLFELSVSPRATDKKAPAQTSENNFFGLAQERRDAAGCVAADATGTARWAQAPPFRFGVEFWDVDALKEKARLHSHTVWYAGSLFNVYVQVVRKKGVQLGVYLHRQSSVDPIPPSSAPAPPAPSPQPRSMVHIPLSPSVSSPATYPRTGGPPTRSSTPHTSPGSPAPASRGALTHAPSMGNLAEAAAPGAVAIPATAPPVMPQQPYRDPRAAVSAYFTIACASATGASLTRFASSPDVFSVSQSWGWKSSSLRTEEYLEVGPDGQPKAQGPGGREVSLRATVVLGLV